MNLDKRIRFAEALFKERIKVQKEKGKAYSGSEDSLANFKRNADLIGVSKYEVWLIYFMKHIDSIINAIKDNPFEPVDRTEGLRGRIIDAENYLDLLFCLLSEEEEKGKGH